jgi:hypothetical protein
MNGETTARLLRSNLAELAEARAHLAVSVERVKNLGASRAGWTVEEMERIEAYTSRFARVIDLLTNKVPRSPSWGMSAVNRFWQVMRGWRPSLLPPNGSAYQFD